MAGFDPSTASPEDDDKPAAPAGFDPSTAEAVKPAGVIRRIADMTAVPLAQGVVAVPEVAVGVADLVTGGRAGKMAEEAGFRPEEAKKIIGDALYSDEQKEANRKVAEAEGFMGTVGAAVENPSTIVRTAFESVPSMLAGGAIGRIARAGVPALSPVTAGAAGEAIVAAGAGAEQLRQQTPDGLLTPEQAGLAAASGAVTGVIGRIAGKAAQRLGVAEPESALVTGSLTPEGAPQAAAKGLTRRVAEGAFTEGVLEELPQSMQEQVFQNIALGKPWNEGVGAAGAMGMLAGGLTGGVVGALSRPGEPAPEAPPKPLLLGYDEKADQLLGYPDGSVARRSEVESYLAGLANDPQKQMAERARLLGVNPVPSWEQPGAQPYGQPSAPTGPITRAAMLAPSPAMMPQPEPEGGEGKGKDGKEEKGANTTPAAAIPSAPVDPAGGPISRAAALAQKQGVTQPTRPSQPVTGPVTAPVTPVTPEASPQAATGNFDSASAQPESDDQADSTVPRETAEFEPQPGDIIVDEHFEAGHGRAATSPANQRPEPTEAQKEAENYAVGRTRVGGLTVSIENAQGTERRGVDPDGKEWSTTMRDHYGRLLGTIGADSTPQRRQHLDVFIKPGTPRSWRGTVFVVDTRKRGGGGFDEHKMIFGAVDEADARRIFARNYDDGEARIGAVSGVPFDTFKGWAYDGTQKSAPYSPDFDPADGGAAPASAPAGPEPAAAGSVAGAQGSFNPATAQPEAPDAGAAPAAAPVGRRSSLRAIRATSYEKNPALTFLATHGLYHSKNDPRSLKREFSPDRHISVPGYHVALFRRDGKFVDQLVAPAIEEGYLPQDGDEQQMYELIARVLRGERVIPQYAEGAVEREVEARLQGQREEAEAALRQLDDEELAAIDESQYDDVPDLDAPSNVPMDAAMRALGFTDEEIENALRADQQQQDPADAPAPAARREGGQGAGQAPGQGSQGTRAEREGPAPEDGVAPPAGPSPDRAERARLRGQKAERIAKALGLSPVAGAVGTSSLTTASGATIELSHSFDRQDNEAFAVTYTPGPTELTAGRSEESWEYGTPQEAEQKIRDLLAASTTPPAPAPTPAPAPDRGPLVELRRRLSILRELRACVAGK